MQKIVIPSEYENIPQGLDFIKQTFVKYKIKRKSMLEALLIAEESMVRLIKNGKKNARMQIVIHRKYNNATVTISMRGDYFESRSLDIDFSDAELGHSSEEAIRSMLLHAHEEKISYYRRGGYNFVKINTAVEKQIILWKTVTALVFGYIIAAILLLFLPKNIINIITAQFLMPIQSVFINALSLVSAPCLFFSIVVNISKYMSLTDPDRISQKVIVSYFFTSVLSVGIGMLVFYMTQRAVTLLPFIGGLFSQTDNYLSDISNVFKMVSEMVPSNVITPFLDSNPVQLLTVAILGGVALGKTGRSSKTIVDIFDAFDRFFANTVEIISKFVPIAVFFVTIMKLLLFGWDSVYVTLIVVVSVFVGLLILLVIYILALVLIARINPVTFLKKSKKTLLKIFFSGSSISSIPDTMKCCEDKLGVSPKVCNFSITFGAISNLDGNCVYLTIILMLLAKISNVEILGNNLVVVVFLVIVFSIGAPITPGSGVVALTMLFNQFGISVGVISLIIGVNVLVEMLLAVSNTLGDIVMTLVIAKQEKLLDMSVYNSKSVKKVRK